MAKPAPLPDHEVNPLFGIIQGGTADKLRIVGPEEILERRAHLQRPGIPAVGEVATWEFLDLGQNGDHDKWLKKFSDMVPRYEQEVTIGLRTAVVHVGIAAQTKDGSAERAVMSALEEIDKFAHLSQVAVRELESALVSKGDIEVPAERLRQSARAKAEMARFGEAVFWFEGWGWHPRKRSPEKPNRKTDGQLKRFVDELSNPAIVEDIRLKQIWKRALASAARGATYWPGQYKEVKKHDYTITRKDGSIDDSIQKVVKSAIERYEKEKREKAVAQARARLAAVGRDVTEPPLPTPVQSGETDKQASQRNARAFREWQPPTSSGTDPELTPRMLDRMRRGDFSMPGDEAQIK